MTVTADSFRSHYREFADSDIYSDPQIEHFISVASGLLNESRWGRQLDYGIELWVAHNLTVSGDKLTNGADSGAGGPITSQHVGEVGFNSSPQFWLQGLKNIGFYSRTSYGIQYYQMAQMVGAGGFQT